MQRNESIGNAGTAMHVMGVLCWMLAFLIGLCMALVPFLRIDRNFHWTPGFSLANARAAWDPVMMEAIANSVALSVIASVFAIVCGAVLIRMIARFPRTVIAGIVLVYTVNPVIRAIAYRDLFFIFTPFEKWMSVVFGEWRSQMIILPALILGMHYLPIYLMRFLFVIRKRNVAHELHGVLDTVFVSLPAFFRGFPISFAIFFLLTFFDYWVIQVIGGGKALYWSQMFEQKAFVARDVGQAGMLIILGLVMTLLAYVLARCMCGVLQWYWKGLRPLAVGRITLPRMTAVRTAFQAVLCAFIAWPFFYGLVRWCMILSEGRQLHLMNGAGRAIALTLFLSTLIALCSTVLAFVFSAFFQEYPRRCRWWLPSLYFLALVPEAAYVLFSLFVTGLGIVKAGPAWLFFLVVSFSAPMSFFLWESLWGEAEQRKLWLLAAAMRGKASATFGFALREWRRFFGITFIVNLWMIVDNVFITNFAAGPKWKPLSAIIFTATKRGFQDAEFLTGSLGSIGVLALVGIVLFFSRHRRGMRVRD